MIQDFMCYTATSHWSNSIHSHRGIASRQHTSGQTDCSAVQPLSSLPLRQDSQLRFSHPDRPEPHREEALTSLLLWMARITARRPSQRVMTRWHASPLAASPLALHASRIVAALQRESHACTLHCVCIFLAPCRQPCSARAIPDACMQPESLQRQSHFGRGQQSPPGRNRAPVRDDTNARATPLR